jgi:hypothetical protein
MGKQTTKRCDSQCLPSNVHRDRSTAPSSVPSHHLARQKPHQFRSLVTDSSKQFQAAYSSLDLLQFVSKSNTCRHHESLTDAHTRPVQDWKDALVKACAQHATAHMPSSYSHESPWSQGSHTHVEHNPRPLSRFWIPVKAICNPSGHMTNPSNVLYVSVMWALRMP